MNGRFIKFVLLMCCVGLIAACTANNTSSPAETQPGGANPPSEQGNTPPVAPDPVTLKLYHFSLTLTDEDYDTYFVVPLKQRFPHVTLERIKPEGDYKNPAGIVLSGLNPDIVFAGVDGMGALRAADLAADISSQLNGYRIDLGKYEPAAISLLRSHGEKGEIFGIPLYLNFGALFYNKDIFDQFGVVYPKDGMLWEEAIELGRRLTRPVDGVQYRGLDMNSAVLLASQLSLDYVDPNTFAAKLNTGSWQRVMSLLKQLADIPGMLPSETQYSNNTDFFQKRNVAMFAYWLNGTVSNLEKLHQSGQPINWDLVSLPSHKEAPGAGWRVDFHNLSLTTVSKHPQQAMEVLSYLVSEEHQRVVSKARVSSMPTAELRGLYGSGIATVQGKNISGALATKPAPRPKPSYDVAIDNAATSAVGAAATEITTKHVDINTALRNAEEKANATIQQILKQ